MTIEQVINYFKGKEDTPCHMTERLVGAGYQQKDGGYIKRAKKEGMVVDYTKNSPSQYWHLMTFAYSRPPQEKFTRTIQCGELIFWMAEVSGTVEKEQLERLANQIIESADLSRGVRPIYDRKKWNREIQNLCFDGLFEKVMNG